MEGQALCEIEVFSTGLKILVNETIKGTIAKSELDSGDYLMTDFVQPDYKRMAEWSASRKAPRQSVTTMDWSRVAEQYAALFRRVLKQC